MTKTPKDELLELYSNKSKHSNYQILPRRLNSILNQDEIFTSTRSEKERLDYFIKKIDFYKKSVMDIGANTGYFSFELLEAGASSVHYIEGNVEHARFVKLAVDTLDLQDKIKITNSYFNFDGSYKDHYDVVLLFNVLHHMGDDYGDGRVSKEEAKKMIIEQLNSMQNVADVVIYQMGFNWKGEPLQNLFNNGTKKEMIDSYKGLLGWGNAYELMQKIDQF